VAQVYRVVYVIPWLHNSWLVWNDVIM